MNIIETVAQLHTFTTHSAGIKCSCGTEVKDISGSWKHTQAMREAASLIQNEKELAKIINPASTCNKCGNEIHYSGHVDSPSACHVHTATGERQCPTEVFNLASPVPHCPKCHSVSGWDVNDHAWGISSNCADCGHHTYYGIGD